MKNIKFFTVFILAFAMFSMTSCDDEPLEGEFSSGTGNGGGNGNGGGSGGASNCVQATNNVADATSAYNQVTSSDPNYTTVCNDYSDALQDFINLCGDSTGVVQTIIDSLDCTASNSDCDDAEAESQVAENAYNADTTNVDLCNAYVTALENEISICGDSDGSLQDIIDNLGC
jgi:hypothetical protein